MVTIYMYLKKACGYVIFMKFIQSPLVDEILRRCQVLRERSNALLLVVSVTYILGSISIC